MTIPKGWEPLGVDVRLNLYFRDPERIGCERADGRAFSDFEVQVVRELLPLLKREMFLDARP